MSVREIEWGTVREGERDSEREGPRGEESEREGKYAGEKYCDNFLDCSRRLHEIKDASPSEGALSRALEGQPWAWSSYRSSPSAQKHSHRPCCAPDTYKHLNGHRDSAVERGVASVLSHDGQVDQPIGDLLVVQGPAHTDH